MSAEPHRTSHRTIHTVPTAPDPDETWRTPSADEIVAVPGVQRALDNGVPWFRSGEELERAFATIETAIAEIVGNGLPKEWDSFDMIERARFGVFQAARWTLQMIPTAPMGSGLVPVTGGSIRRELDRAHTGLLSRREGWDYAMGVATWLMWITGARDELVLPGERPAQRG